MTYSNVFIGSRRRQSILPIRHGRSRGRRRNTRTLGLSCISSTSRLRGRSFSLQTRRTGSRRRRGARFEAYVRSARSLRSISSGIRWSDMCMVRWKWEDSLQLCWRDRLKVTAVHWLCVMPAIRVERAMSAKERLCLER